MKKFSQFPNLISCLFLFLGTLPINPNHNPISTVTEAVEKIRVFGTITDENNLPISNVAISIYDETWSSPLGNSISDVTGKYSIDISRQTKIQILVEKGFINREIYVNLFIPISRYVVIGNNNEIRQDFVLSPAGNLVLGLYDEENEILRTGALEQISEDDLYISDLSMMPMPSGYSFRPVYDNFARSSGWDYQQSLPSFSIPLHVPVAIHFQWPIPGFGIVIINADNNGKGYVIDTQGDYYIIKNLVYEAAVSEYTKLQLHLDQFLAQEYSVSKDVSDEIKESMDKIRDTEEIYKNSSQGKSEVTSVAENALKSILTAQEKLTLLEAVQSIDKSRKGNAQIRVINESGTPVENAIVTFQQQTHDFLFGSDPMGPNGDFHPIYATLLRDAGINYSYIRFGYGDVEKNPGQFDWGIIDDYQNLPAQEKFGFDFFGGLALWFSRDVRMEFSPVYQEEMTFSELKTNIFVHMRQIAGRYKDQISVWEFNEQNLSQCNVLNLTWNEKFDIYRTAISGIKTGNPEAKILFNVLALPYESSLRGTVDSFDEIAGGISPLLFLSELNAHNIPYDYIGLEFYFSGADSEGNSQPPLTMSSLNELIDLYSEFEKPIYIRELSAPSVQQPNTTWWHRPWDEATQAEYLNNIYSIAFSKPMVVEIGWSYGISDLDPGPVLTGGILNSDLKPKASYYELKNLILNEWKTEGKETTGPEGIVDIHGFAGDYIVMVSAENGESVTSTLHIDERRENEFVITMPLMNSITPTINDTNERSTMEYTVPRWISFLVSIGLVAIGFFIFFQYHNRRK